MGAIERERFFAAIRKARAEDKWPEAVHSLSGLAMFDILPALDGIDKATRERLSKVSKAVLAPGAFKRIEFATFVVSTKTLGTLPDLPEPQVQDARRWLFDIHKPTSSQANVATFATMDAAATRAIDEVRLLTAVLSLEFSGAIYKQAGGFRFSAPVMGGRDSSPVDVSVPRGAESLGCYHTHPPVNPNAENFSAEDLVACRGVKDNSGRIYRLPFVLYVGTPTGRIKKLTPPALLQGPDAETYKLLGKQDILR